MRGLNTYASALARFVRNRVHPLAGDGIDVGRLAENHRQHVVASGGFRQMDVGFQADALVVADLFGRHDIIQILGHRVRVERHARADNLWRAEPQTAHGIARAVDQILGELAGLNFFGEFFLVDWVKNVV
jgi:hypothetical protein